MGRGIRHLMAAALLAVGIAGMVPQQAHGQEKVQPPPKPMPTPVVAVIDFQYVVKESAAGKSVRSQIDARQQQVQAEIKPIQQELESVRAEFGGREAGAADAEYAAKRKAIRDRVNELQGIIQERKRELDAMFNSGMHEVDLAQLQKRLHDNLERKD